MPLNHQNFLKKVPLFTDLSESEFDILINGLELLTFKENTKVIEIGDQLGRVDNSFKTACYPFTYNRLIHLLKLPT